MFRPPPRVQIIEEIKYVIFMTAKVKDHVLMREQMAIELQKSMMQELLWKRSNPVFQFQKLNQAPEDTHTD